VEDKDPIYKFSSPIGGENPGLGRPPRKEASPVWLPRRVKTLKNDTLFLPCVVAVKRSFAAEDGKKGVEEEEA
jgi:hypothetical protein